ncbi:glucosamine-6-phosphate deaminase [Falsibacillus albus]|uniref:Glucosamine-6-phosphate deaminase n=1 Tax=Falsibacillus albus TaxID=2478915 RepID=A0A3L7K1V8_9BACI|nr:glucosamine-6-phosphate deaminase [Falsibacillus albus]RLQ96595.1 glucosamine-6-phosphate deaminase [Falsibacillus albus]
MKIIQTKDYSHLSRVAAEKIIHLIKQKPNAVLGLATGSTPKGVYEQLVLDHKQNQTTYQHIRTVNLDEYVGISADHPNSYHSFMRKNLFQYIDIHPNHTHIPNGKTDNLDKECLEYDQLIHKLSGIDLQLLGIGHNGHIGFNEPHTSFSSQTHVVQLAQSTREANSRFFSSIEDVPSQAITMGIQTIMNSKQILLLVSGKSKAKTLERLVNGFVTEAFPASILQQHPNVTIIADEDAMSILNINDSNFSCK